MSNNGFDMGGLFVRRLFKKSNKVRKQEEATQTGEALNEIHMTIEKNLEDNLNNLQNLLGNPSDLIIREVLFNAGEIKGAICYISNMADNQLINNNILRNIQKIVTQNDFNILDQIYQKIIAITYTEKIQSFDKVITSLLSGSTLLFLDGNDTVLVMETEGTEKRSIEEPQSEAVIRGPRVGFVESIQTNISLIRREIKDPNLRFETSYVGRRSKQKLIVCYVEGIVNPEIVNEIMRRLGTIDIDYLPNSGFIEKWIEDNPFSPFPQLFDTESPDRLVYEILQGKVAILLDGNPYAFITPMVFKDILQSMDDITQRWLISTFLNLIRYFSFFIALLLPSIYVALVSYNPGLIPSHLAFSIAGSRENVPFPAIIEALMMVTTLEILLEAGLRLPKPIGQTIGIVGGIIIGEAAVTAGIASPIMVVVTALTAVASFTIPNYSIAIGIRVLRIGLIILAGILGVYGLVLGYIMINIHIVHLKSVGVPYSAPFSENLTSYFNNLFIRAPLKKMKERPSYLHPINRQKINNREEEGDETT